MSALDGPPSDDQPTPGQGPHAKVRLSHKARTAIINGMPGMAAWLNEMVHIGRVRVISIEEQNSKLAEMTVAKEHPPDEIVHRAIRQPTIHNWFVWLSGCLGLLEVEEE